MQPPKGDEPIVDRILDDSDRSAERLAAAAQAAAANDRAGFGAVAEAAVFTDRAEERTSDYGFEVCARSSEAEPKAADTSEDERVFEDEDFGITFRYPDSLSEG